MFERGKRVRTPAPTMTTARPRKGHGVIVRAGAAERWRRDLSETLVVALGRRGAARAGVHVLHRIADLHHGRSPGSPLLLFCMLRGHLLYISPQSFCHYRIE